MRKLKLLLSLVALLFVGLNPVNAETDYTNLMSSEWTINATNPGNFQSGKEAYNTSNYAVGKIIYQSFTAPAAGIYEIKFYAVTSSTSGRGFTNIFGDNIAQAYATAGSNKSTVAMTVIDQTGCTLVADANIRTLSVEAAEGETIEYGIENIATGGNWYTIKELSAKMKTVTEIFQDQYEEAYAIWNNSTENEVGAKATFKTYVDAMQTALSGTLAEAQTASDNLAAALVTYESKSYPVKGSGVKYDFTSKMNMAINAWTCPQGTCAQYGFTGATESYKSSAMSAGDVMYQTISGLANGEYEIHFYAVANNPRNESNSGSGLAYVYANDVTVDIEVIGQDACTPSDYERTLTVMVKDGTLKYGISNKAAAGNWYVCKNVALYMTGAPDLSDYYDAIAENLATASGLLSSKMGPTAKSGLNAAISGAEGYDDITVTATLETINQNLIDAISAANASISDYANLLAAITAAGVNYTPLAANASAYNTAISSAQSVYDNETADDCASTIASLQTALQTANVADYNHVTTNYSYAVELGTWTKDNAIERSSQHWDGTSTSTYNEQNNGWSAASWTCSYSQNLTLPAGNYVFKVAGRKSSDSATLTLEVKNGETTIGTVSNFPNGDTGYGINKKGEASFNSEDAEGFAKNPNHTSDDLEGCGWQWRFVEFELSDPATVSVAIKGSASAVYQWVGFCNATVQTDNEENVELMEALVALNSAKTAATLTKRTANVGDGVFQYNATVNNTLWSAYETAKQEADEYTLSATSTAEEVNTLVANLTTAISNFQNAELNAPAADKRYTLTLADRGVLTAISADTDGGFGMPYQSANSNKIQSFTFTKISGNNYKLSFVGNDGATHYICNGLASGYNAGTKEYGIRTTTIADDALSILVQASETDGVFFMLNTTASNNKLGSNDGDFYTDAKYSNWSIAEASQASVNVTIDEDVKYATRIFPFTPSLPTGVKAYSCEAKGDGDVLTLVEVATPAANTPYILYAENGITTSLSGWGTAAADNYTAGWLTGVYTATEAPIGNYVLQNNGGTVGFYKVEDADSQPTIGANRCYLTVPDAGSKAFFFDSEALGISAISALTAGEAEVYNLNGVRLPNLQKGMNIIKMKNGRTQKVMVK